MNTAKKKYQKQCKIKTVTFYKTADDQELYKCAQSMNFQKFVKQKLREVIIKRELIVEQLKENLHNLDLGGEDNGNIQKN